HLADRVTQEVRNEIRKIEALKAALERTTSQRDQLSAEIKDLQENRKQAIAVRDTQIERLKDALRREIIERKDTADLILDSLSQIQRLTNAVTLKDKSLPDAWNRSPRPAEPTSCYRWLNVIGLCLFIGLTPFANIDDMGPGIENAGENQIGVISNKTEYAEPAYYKAIKEASTKYDLDPNLIATVIYVESRGNVLAVSQKGAKGLMQLTPAVYDQYNMGDPFDIEQNVSVGTAYLAYLLRRFDGNLEHALAAYNCGPTRVIEHNGIPPIKETQEYVERIMEHYRKGEIPTGFIDKSFTATSN
ncbi:MAG: transglycosylase SLT domain-containing protein, partial [Syntrophaceae bacterium]